MECDAAGGSPLGIRLLSGKEKANEGKGGKRRERGGRWRGGGTRRKSKNRWGGRIGWDGRVRCGEEREEKQHLSLPRESLE